METITAKVLDVPTKWTWACESELVRGMPGLDGNISEYSFIFGLFQ